MLPGFSNFGIHFDFFSILFFLPFVFVFGLFAFIAVKGLRQWNKNNHSPRLTVPATVVAKRISASHRHGADAYHSAATTSYYVTFQVESGDRLELHVIGQEYGLLIEGDQGMLTFQGTRYISFQRN